MPSRLNTFARKARQELLDLLDRLNRDILRATQRGQAHTQRLLMSQRHAVESALGERSRRTSLHA